MTSVNDAFPSKWLKASDLQGREHTLTISRIVSEEIKEGERMHVMYFQGAGKGMILKKTNAQTIAYVHGEEMDAWVGRQVVLFVQMVQFNTGMVPAIRCRGVPMAGKSGGIAMRPATGALPNPTGAAAMSQPLGMPASTEGYEPGQDLDDLDNGPVPF